MPVPFIMENKPRLLDFPGGPGVKNLPANAGDTGSIPDPGRFDVHLSLNTTTTKPVLQSPSSPTREAGTAQLENSPYSSQLQKV